TVCSLGESPTAYGATKPVVIATSHCGAGVGGTHRLATLKRTFSETFVTYKRLPLEVNAKPNVPPLFGTNGSIPSMTLLRVASITEIDAPPAPWFVTYTRPSDALSATF